MTLKDVLKHNIVSLASTGINIHLKELSQVDIFKGKIICVKESNNIETPSFDYSKGIVDITVTSTSNTSITLLESDINIKYVLSDVIEIYRIYQKEGQIYLVLTLNSVSFI